MAEPVNAIVVRRSGRLNNIPRGPAQLARVVGPAVAGAVANVLGSAVYNYGKGYMKEKGRRAAAPKKKGGTANVTNARTGTVTKVRNPRKRKKGSTSKLTKITKRLKTLEISAPKKAIRMCRGTSAAQYTSNANSIEYTNLAIWYSQHYAQKIDNLRFFDRGTTPGDDTINIANTAFATNVLFRNIALRIEGRNNNTLPCKPKLYWWRCKEDTSLNPTDIQATVQTNYGVSNANSVVGNFITDYRKEIEQYWDLVKVDTFSLQPGDEFNSNFNMKTFKYDPARYADYSATYHKNDIVVTFRMIGVIGHDSGTTSSVGILPSGIDVLVHRKFFIHYQSDTSFRDIEIETNLGAFATGGEATLPSDVTDEKDAV